MSTILDYMGRKPSGDLPGVNADHPKVLKPQLDGNMSKQIMQNMESVIKSLKRRHKHKKHRQKRATKAAVQESPSIKAQPAAAVDADGGEESDEEEEESLASLKETWLSARKSTARRSDGEAHNKSLVDPDKRNAFQMLMGLNGTKTNQETSLSSSISTNDENQGRKVSPEGGKRKLSSGQKESGKRRKVKTGVVAAAQPPATTELSPKSPVKKRRKKKLFECFVETVEPKKPPPSDSPVVIAVDPAQQESVPVDNDPCGTPSSSRRPRRSCAAKVTYKDDDTSPVSTSVSAAAVGIKKPIRTPSTAAPATPKTVPKPKDTSPPSIIDVEAFSPSLDPADKAKKLAPLFVKAMPKPTVDPKVREARQSFLMSDLPEKMRLEMEKKKQLQEEVSIRQLALFPEISHVVAVNGGTGDSSVTLYEEERLFPRTDPHLDSSPLPPAPPPPGPCSILRVERDTGAGGALLPALSLLKTEHQKKQLVRNLKAEGDGRFPAYKFYKWLAKRGESKAEEQLLFSHTYRPQVCSEFVFNLGAVTQVREYLESFNVPPPENGDGSSYETDDECSNSMDAFAGGSGHTRQTLVLHGDCASGKTSAVYAIAEELNYNVIEINASERRNGSKLLNKLMEATQSHKVVAATKAKGSLSLSRKLLRRMEREEKKMSIIFIEDVDVIFAEDTGFLAAIVQLMSMTKRPIILTTNNRASPNLRKTFDAHHSFKFLFFKAPTMTHSADCLAFLHLVGVVQGCNFDPDYLRHLFEELCRRDLRQALLHLSFIAMTKEIDLRWSGETERVDIPCCNLEEEEVDGEDSCTDLAWTMDSLCAADVWRARGMEEEQQVMGEEFREMCLLGNSLLDSRCDGTFYRETQYSGTRSLSNYTDGQSTRTSKVTVVEVEPLLRTICRSEATRKEVQRSTSKFSHYLLRDRDLDCISFGAEFQRSSKENLEFFSASCSVFKEGQ